MALWRSLVRASALVAVPVAILLAAEFPLEVLRSSALAVAVAVLRQAALMMPCLPHLVTELVRIVTLVPVAALAMALESAQV